MNNQPIIRYSRRCHQPIEWGGNGLYMWLPDRCVWRRMSASEVEDWIRDPSGREENFGLTKDFMERSTLPQIINPDDNKPVAWDGSGWYHLDPVAGLWYLDDPQNPSPDRMFFPSKMAKK